MATAIQFLRSADRALRPTPTELSVGMPMINYNSDDGGLYFRLSDDSLGKVGTAHHGSTPPNTNALGITGNIAGELWVDNSGSTGPLLKFYDPLSGWTSVNSSDGNLDSLTVSGEVILNTDGVSQFKVEGQSFFNDSVSIDGALSVTGSATFGQNCTGSFTVDSPADLKCNTVIGQTSNNRLDVFSESFFGHNLSVAGDLIVGTTLNDQLVSKASAFFKETVEVDKATTLKDTLNVALAANFASTLDVVGITTVDQLEVNSIGAAGSSCGNTTKVYNSTEFYCDLLVGGTLPATPNVSIGADGTVEAVQFVGDGSQLTNLSIPGSLTFRGSLDATTDTAPAAVTGDFYLNTGDGTVDASYTGAAGETISDGQYVYYSATSDWIVSGDTASAYVTVTTTQTVLGEKTFNTDTHFSKFDTTSDASIGGDLGVTGDVTVTATTTLSDTLDVTGATTLSSTLSVAGVTTIGTNAAPAALSVSGNTTIGDSVANASLTVTGSGSFTGTLGVIGNTSIGDINNASTLTVAGKATLNSLEVTNAAEVGGTLEVTGTTTLNDVLTISANTIIAGDITPNAANTSSIGSTAKPMLAVYSTDVFTGDLHLSNESRGGNSVDGTVGSWTVQEGRENLYIINNATGAKFKISMEPV